MLRNPVLEPEDAVQRPDVPRGGDPAFDVEPHPLDPAERPVGDVVDQRVGDRRDLPVGKVGVEIDQAGHDGHALDVDHPRPGRPVGRSRRHQAGDPVPLDHHVQVPHAGPGAIEDPPADQYDRTVGAPWGVPDQNPARVVSGLGRRRQEAPAIGGAILGPQGRGDNGGQQRRHQETRGQHGANGFKHDDLG